MNPSALPKEHSPSKVSDLSAKLNKLARDKGPGAKLPTVRELCNSYGLSISTVKDVLEQLERQNIIYRKARTGIYVSPTIHRTLIGIVCNPSFFAGSDNSPFWTLLWDRLMTVARERAEPHNEAYSLHIAMHANHPGDLVQEGLTRLVESKQVHGILAIGLDCQPGDWLLEQKHVPIVAFSGTGQWYVSLDHDHIIRQGVDTLAAAGCKKIGYLATIHRGSAEIEGIHARALNVFREALTSHGLEFKPEFIVGRLPHEHTVPPDHRTVRPDHPAVQQILRETKQKQGYLAASSLFDPNASQYPDGIYVADDLMTQGLLPVLAKLNVRIGHDVKIATLANEGSSVLAGYEDVLIRLEFSIDLIARKMFEVLDQARSGAVPPGTAAFVRSEPRFPADG